MTDLKMTDRALKTVNRNDVVTETAVALAITPEEVFRRAYAGAGNEASFGEDIFRRLYYPGTERKFYIPTVVKDFCIQNKTQQCTECGATEPKESKKMLSRIAPNGTAQFFCSLECMSVVPKAPAPARRGRQPETSSPEGKEIFHKICLAVTKATLVTVDASLIRFMPNQPRKFFDQTRLQNLADSMNLPRLKSDDPDVTGQLMPGYIRPVPKGKDGTVYELLDGERRLRACHLAGIPKYRALLIELDDEGARHVVSIIANFNREGHTVLEMADTVCHLHEELGFTFQEIASTIGKHYNQVLDFYRLRLLVPAVRDLLDPDKTSSKEMLTQGAAFEIAKVPEGQQLALAKRTLSGEMRVVDLKQHLRERGGTGGRQISASERKTTLVGAIQRLPTTVKGLDTAVSQALRSGALDLFSDEELKRLQKTLLDCRAVLDNALTVIKPD